MCNPRRIHVTVTREVRQKWRKEISRSVRLGRAVRGEVPVTYKLGTKLPAPVLEALAKSTAATPGWRQVEDGYRYEIEGGYVLFRPRTAELVMVAVEEGEAEAEATVEEVVGGEVGQKVTVEATAPGGRLSAETEAALRRRTERKAAAIARRELNEKQRRAAEAADDKVSRRARDEASKKLDVAAEAKQEELERAAGRRLEVVSRQCLNAFYGVLGPAYKEAILAYAEREGAELVTCEEDEETIDVELRLTA